ncbi:hypothetical protein FRC00_007973 [Tulasnella sp. 408]|nr:hypothetical protein FRC00_007973 [Tulasnella sp. 408]
MTSPRSSVQHLSEEMLQVPQAGRSPREDRGHLHQGESWLSPPPSEALPVGSIDIRYRKVGGIATQVGESEEDATVEDKDFVVGEMLSEMEDIPSDPSGSDNDDSDRETAAAASDPLPPRPQDDPGRPASLTAPRQLPMDKEALKRAAKQAKSRKKKRKRREKRDETGDDFKRVRLAHLATAETILTPELDVAAAEHSSSGYIGLRHRALALRLTAGPARTRFRKLLGHGYEVLTFSKENIDHPLVDKDSRVYAVVLAWPTGWSKRISGVNEAMRRLQARLSRFKPPPNRRGAFAAYATGFSFGGGQTAPTPIARTDAEKAALSEFLNDDNVVSYFKFIEGECCDSKHDADPRLKGAMKTWFPDHVQAYRAQIRILEAWDSSLQRPSAHLYFSALTINCDPSTICWPHRDSANDAAGICLDGILGDFDPTKGGHLVFHEPKRILELGPGRVVLFPSALITHETIPIPADAWRSGVTGYFAGGLSRFIAQGMQTRREWEEKGNPEELSEHDERGPERWAAGVARFQTLADLCQLWLTQG